MPGMFFETQCTNNAIYHTLQTFVWQASFRSYWVKSTALQLTSVQSTT